MSKRGNGLTILALLIGMGGMGLGVYAVFFMPTIMGQASGDSEISEIWTVEQSGSFTPPGTFGDMTNMNVNITVNTGETVYGIFSAQFNLGATGTYFIGGARIMRDGVAIPGSQKQFTIERTGGTGSTWYSLTTQFTIDGLAAGTYELQVQVYAYSGAGSINIDSGLLLVYTYR